MSLTKDDLDAIMGLLDGKFSKIDEQFSKIDEQFSKIDSRLSMIEVKQDRDSRKLSDLQLDVKIAERDIRRDIRTLNDEMETVVEVLKQHELMPHSF